MSFIPGLAVAALGVHYLKKNNQYETKLNQKIHTRVSKILINYHPNQSFDDLPDDRYILVVDRNDLTGLQGIITFHQLAYQDIHQASIVQYSNHPPTQYIHNIIKQEPYWKLITRLILDFKLPYVIFNDQVHGINQLIGLSNIIDCEQNEGRYMQPKLEKKYNVNYQCHSHQTYKVTHYGYNQSTLYLIGSKTGPKFIVDGLHISYMAALRDYYRDRYRKIADNKCQSTLAIVGGLGGAIISRL